MTWLNHFFDNGAGTFQDDVKNSEIEVSECSRPTQSVLSGWLRKKHSIDVEPHLVLLMVNHNEIEQENEYRTYHCALRVKGITRPLHDLIDKTFPESYEYGLQEALKLIK